jgi:hypothetical protein
MPRKRLNTPRADSWMVRFISRPTLFDAPGSGKHLLVGRLAPCASTRKPGCFKCPNTHTFLARFLDLPAFCPNNG